MKLNGSTLCDLRSKTSKTNTLACDYTEYACIYIQYKWAYILMLYNCVPIYYLGVPIYSVYMYKHKKTSPLLNMLAILNVRFIFVVEHSYSYTEHSDISIYRT